jgi:beta-ureidopropionase
MSRKVRICTISMNAEIHGNRTSREDRFREAEQKIQRGALDKPDLFLLPEHFLVNDAAGVSRDPETPGNPTYQRLGALARSTQAYIAASLYTPAPGGLYNSLVLFDRSGKPVFLYHKTHPAPGELRNGIVAGPHKPDAFDADFGRLGMAVCYDLNFQHLFRHYYDLGVEVLLFSSYFPGGLLLQSWCYLYSFFAVSSHAQGYESVFINNMGFEVARGNMFMQALTHTLELDSVAVPYWGNHEAILAAKKKYGPDLDLNIHRIEGDAVISYLGSATSAKDILAEFKIRTRREYYNNEHLL